MTTNTEEVLVERGKRYGKFTGHATVSQTIQNAIISGYNAAENHEDDFKLLPHDIKESLFMIAHKLGRIANGDPFYADSWVDIAGYAKLVADRLEQEIER